MFSFLKLPNSYPIAVTNKKRTVYFLPEIDPDEEALKSTITENNNLKFDELKELLFKPILHKEITLGKDEEFTPLPITHNNQRVAMTCIANSGSGKSTFIAKFIEQYHKKHPENEVFLLSNKNEGDEPAFKDLDYIQYIPINSLNEPINIKNFQDCLFLFDDIHEGVILEQNNEFRESIKEKSYAQQQKIIQTRQKQLDDIVNQSTIQMLTLGRSRRISICIIKHQFRDGKSSVYKLENNALVVWISSNKSKSQEYLKNIEGLSNEQIKRLFNLKESRGTFQYLYISRIGLKYAISQRNIISLDID